MALRDQPYIPLYVQDFLTDEKLMECSASATGIYIRIMCIMHKSDEYGTILLKQKDKQSSKQVENFALKLAKYLPYDINEIIKGLTELINEDVLQTNGDKLSQKRMVKDNAISIVRSSAGKKGGLKTQFAKAKNEANLQANSENETENEIVFDFENVITGRIKEYWEKWKKYKKDEFNFNFNSEISEEEAKKDLISLSENNADMVMEIIDYSIACGYKKFVKPEKDKKNGRPREKQSVTTLKERATIVAETLGTDSRRNSK